MDSRQYLEKLGKLEQEAKSGELGAGRKRNKMHTSLTLGCVKIVIQDNGVNNVIKTLLKWFSRAAQWARVKGHPVERSWTSLPGASVERLMF